MSKSILTPEVRAVLENSRIEGNNLYLPEGQLERKLYQDVDKHIKNCGGKWNRSAKAHVFDSCPKEKLGMVLDKGVSVDKKTETQAFYTPSFLAQKVVELANVKGKSVLEPSAGIGNLADECERQGAKDICCIELDSESFQKLKRSYSKHNLDFLSVTPKDVPGIGDMRFEVIVQNPPFTKNQDIKHVLHAIENWLATGGRIVAIMPDKPHPKLDKYNPVEYKVEAGAFKTSGTMIKTKIVVIDLE